MNIILNYVWLRLRRVYAGEDDQMEFHLKSLEIYQLLLPAVRLSDSFSRDPLELCNSN